MAEESVAEGVLARLEEGEDIGDALRDDIERREGLFFREWARTTDGWQGIATPAGGAATAEEPPPRRVSRDDPDINILLFGISDLGTFEDDEAASLAYVNLVRSTFANATKFSYRIGMFSDGKPSDTYVGAFAADLRTAIHAVKGEEKLLDQIHFIGHGAKGVGMLFADEFDAGTVAGDVESLPLKPNGVIVLFGCFTKYGPFYDWALAKAKEAGPRAEVCAFEDD
jgi:hypothetical protein